MARLAQEKDDRDSEQGNGGRGGREQIKGSCLRQQNSQGYVFPGPSLYFIIT